MKELLICVGLLLVVLVGCIFQRPSKPITFKAPPVDGPPPTSRDVPRKKK